MARKIGKLTGIFPNRRKKQFEEITEEEFAAVERIYKEIFNS